MIPETARETAEAALRRLDRILAERPAEVHADLAAAVRGVIALRDALIHHRRATGAAGESLEQANRLVSLAVSAEFPIAGLHWDRIEATRDGLRQVLARV